jgi:hypothetical protein
MVSATHNDVDLRPSSSSPARASTVLEKSQYRVAKTVSGEKQRVGSDSAGKSSFPFDRYNGRGVLKLK